MKTYIVIHNLNSRGKNLSQEYVEYLFKSNDIPFKYFSTSTIDELNNVIVKYSDSNKFQYCAIGGDGSINSLINALMNNDIKNPDVACLPAGSGSDFIRTFALPQNIEETINHLTTDTYYEVDVGRVESENIIDYIKYPVRIFPILTLGREALILRFIFGASLYSISLFDLPIGMLPGRNGSITLFLSLP